MKYFKIIKLLKQLFFNLDNLADNYAENRLSSGEYEEKKQRLCEYFIELMYLVYKKRYKMEKEVKK